MLDEPGTALGQSIAQVPPFSISGNPLVTSVHWQVSPTLVERDKMLSQGLQTPAPSSTKTPGHVHVPPSKDDPIKIVAQSGTQALAPLSTKSPGHVHVLSTKVDPVKKLSQLSVQVAPFGQTQVSPFPSKLDPGKMRLQSGTHLTPVGPDPGRPEVSAI